MRNSWPVKKASPSLCSPPSGTGSRDVRPSPGKVPPPSQRVTPLRKWSGLERLRAGDHPTACSPESSQSIVASQSVDIGSYTGEIVSAIVAQAFDYLDAPVLKVGARTGIAPQSHILEAAFLPNADDIAKAAKSIL